RFGDNAPRLINMYGITETTVHVTYRPLSLADLELEASSPIGAPIPDLSWYVLDADLNPVAKGCTGELYVGRAGLARGYLNRGDLTATRFIPDLFGNTGERLYRTGDLARYHADGVIEYIGRIDQQVKIRGFRIELGEIEARLLEQPEVASAVVLAHNGPLGTQLVGYVVPKGQAEDGLREVLRARLKETLPDYMVPAHLLQLDALPLTANGKLDRKALPAPDASQAQQAYVAPRSELEQRIAAIWQDVLKVERVGLADNFFELGGDSIISIQVVSRARQAGIRFTPKELFQHQTVQGLASVAQQGEAQAQIDQGPVQGEMPLLPIQQRFFEQAIPQRHHWNQSVLLAPAQPLDPALLEAALQALVAQHDALRLSFAQGADGWQARFVERAAQPLLWVRDCDDLEALGNQAQRSLDLANGPLLRAVLATLADGQQRLLLIVHHLVVDGVSWRVLFEDLQQAYQQLQAGQAVQLPAKTSSLKAWAERLAQYAQGDALQAELAYWREQLQDVPATLPGARLDASLSNARSLVVQTRLDRDTTRQLLQQAPAAYRTQVNDLLLTALARVLVRWTGHPHALIQLEGHGREALFDDVDLVRTLGWFTTVFPLRLTPAESLAASIMGIKEQLRAVPGKGLGFGVLRHLGAPAVREALAGLAQPRVTFNYLGQFDASFDDPQALFEPCAEASGDEQDADAPLGNWLSLDGQVYNGELSMGWTFSQDMFAEPVVQALADDYADELRALVAHCLVPDNRGLTPSDVPLAGLDQRQLLALPFAAGQVQDLYPLSPMQQGMLFHSLLEQGNGDYIVQMRVDVDGLDPERFRQAWQAALDNHDILRSAFLWQGEFSRPLQVVLQGLELPFALHDWRGRDDLAAALDALAIAERQQGFDLAAAPLVRLQLLRTGEHRHHFIYTSHHILLDGWSNSQLLGEVLQRYHGVLPPAPQGRYRDYIAWLGEQDAAASERYWKAQTASLDAPTRLAAAIGESDGEGHGDLQVQLDAALADSLQQFARQQKVTLNTLLQAAWLLLLQRYTGQAAVAMGATVAGRPVSLPGIEQQIGLFINTLPVIASPQPQHSVADWVQAVQAQNLSLREHEHTPLYDVQRWSGLGGELFDSLLVFENYPVSKALQQDSDEAVLRFGEVLNRDQVHYPLTVLINAGADIELHYSYLRSHFSAAAIERLAGHLQCLLQAMVGQPSRALGALPMLEQVDHSPVALDYPQDRCIHEQIEARAEATPDALALIDGEQRYSYAQVNAR
ncbi:condensation domain-containing protein, partial [Pseudomonas sp. ES1]